MKKNILHFIFNLVKSSRIIAFVIFCPSIIFGQIQNNLLLDLDFENTLIDSSTANQSTSSFGTTSYTTDRWGNANAAIKFSGTSNSGEVRLTDHLGTYKTNIPASFSAWIKIDAFETANSPILTTEDHGSSYSGFWVEISPAGAVLATFGNGGSVSATNRKTFETATGLITLNTWHHIVVVVNSASSAEIYVDGFSKSVSTTGSAINCLYHSINGTAGKIGGYVKGSTNRTLNGSVDKVKIFGAALTASEALALYYVNYNNHSTLLLNYDLNNNYLNSSIYTQTSAQYGTCLYENDRISNASSALTCSATSAIEIQEATGNFKTNFPMTFATWIKLDGLTAVNPIFTNDDNTSTYSGMWIQVGSDGKLSVSIGDNTGIGASDRRSYTTVSSVLSANSTWNHLAVVLKPATGTTQFKAEVYINGILKPVGAQTGSGGLITYNTTSGNWGKLGNYTKGSSTTYTLDGALDGAMFWDDSLSQKQILNIINNYHNTCLTAPLVTATASATTLCNGTSLTLSGGGAVTYTWTGGVTDNVSFTPTSSQIYTVVGVDGNSCLGLDTISVQVLSPVSINASATTVCAGTSVTLSGNGAINYMWSDGVVNGMSFIPSTTETYAVTGVEVNNCGNSDSLTITVNDLPTVTVTASADSVCSGTTVTLQGGGANTYTWTGNVTDNVGFIPTATATYTVTATDIHMCVNTTTATVVVNDLPDTSISVTGNTITAASISGANYQWLNCGNNGYTIISWETTQSFTATVAGNYAVIVTLNGCSDTSSCIAISSVGISDNENEIISFYPNPTDGLVTLINKQKENLGITLEDYSGKVVYTTQTIDEKQQLDFTYLANGLYFLKLKKAEETTIHKLLISK
jgi:hypothetical protein